jgi:hypothetical protein
VSTIVRRKWPNLGFFVVNLRQEETRYFNGRKYTVIRSLEHYIHPRAHDRDFSLHTTAVLTETRPWNTEITRFSEVSW